MVERDVSAARPFVGRDSEIELLEAGLSDAIAGRGRLYLIAGDPGIGKTRLADELAARAATRAVRVLWGRCWEGEAAPAYWPWTQIFRAYAQSRASSTFSRKLCATDDALAAILPELADADVERDAPTLGEARFRLFESTAAFLRSAAEQEPLMVVLDDIHAADEASLLLLRFCARDLITARVLFVCTYRDTEVRLHRAVAMQLVDLRREGQRMVLTGWDRTELESWLRSRNDPRLPVRLAEEIHRVTDGNPFFVDEIARELAAGRLVPGQLHGESPVPVPEGIRQTISNHLASLPESCVEWLLLASVIGIEFDVDILRRLVSRVGQAELCSLPAAAGHLAPAVAAGVLRERPGHAGPFGFAHALVRETLRHQMTTNRRMHLHVLVGEVLEHLLSVGGAVPPAQLAFHFFQGAAAGGAEKAAYYARRAGDEALRRAAYEDAAMQYQQGLDALNFAGADASARGELLIALGSAQRCAGRIPEAREAFRRVARLARENDWSQLAARAALGFSRVGETGAVDLELVDLLSTTLEHLTDTDSAHRARLLARLAMALYFSTNPDDRQRRENFSVEAVALARRVGDLEALGAALIARHFVLWGPSSTATRLEISVELIDIAVRIGDPEMELEARLWQALDLLEGGDGAGFLCQRDALEAGAQKWRLPVHLWHVEVLRGLWGLACGDLPCAERALVDANLLGEKYHIVRAPQFFAAQLFHVRREQGRLAELEPAVRAYAEQFAALPVWQCGLALLYADLGRHDDARRAMEAALADDPTRWPADGNWLPCLVMLAEVCAALGDRARAARLCELLSPHADVHVVVFDGVALLGPVHHFLGLLSATMGDPTAARHHWMLARDQCERMGAHALAERSQRAWAGSAPIHTENGRDSVTHSEPAAANEWVLRPEGEFWTVAFAGTESRVKHVRGLSYIAHLISHAGEEVHAIELAAIPRGGRGTTTTVEPGARRADAPAYEPLVDAQARSAYRQRLRDLQQELDEAEQLGDLGRVERLHGEQYALTAELSRALGLGGRTRATSSAGERARVAVTKAIATALRTLGQINPPLREHLTQRVQTGMCCSYRPDPQDAGRWNLGG